MDQQPGAATAFLRTTPASGPRQASSSDFTELARSVREAGLLRRRYGYYWVRLAAVPLLTGGFRLVVL
jgi:hypothetical protein